MTFDGLKTITKLGFINFWRNRWLSLAATLIMTLTLLIISMFVLFNVVIKTTTDAIREKIDLVVYFNDDAPQEKIDDLRSSLALRSDVKTIQFISKEEAYKRWASLNTTDKIKNLITAEENPLPRSLEIKATDPERLDNIATFISIDQYKPLIRSISYQKNKDIIQKLINITKFSEKAGLIASIIFIAIAVLVILNTIKLTINSREDEISIMRLVGASDIFIRIPFFIESALYGIFAAILTVIALGCGLNIISPIISRYLGSVNLNLSEMFWQFFWLILLLELVVGILISVICCFVSIRKHIKI